MIQTLDKSDICPAKPIYTNEFGLFRLNAPEYKLQSERLSHIMYCSFDKKKTKVLRNSYFGKGNYLENNALVRHSLQFIQGHRETVTFWKEAGQNSKYLSTQKLKSHSLWCKDIINRSFLFS